MWRSMHKYTGMDDGLVYGLVEMLELALNKGVNFITYFHM